MAPVDRPTSVLIFSGDTAGYLSPCGCTYPMSGGIRRQVQAARSLTLKGATTIVDNGGLVVGISRQDELKAEALAEILGKAGWAAIHFGPAEAALGHGMTHALQDLSGGRLLASGAEPDFRGAQLGRYKIDGRYIIGTASASDEAFEGGLAPLQETVEKLVKNATAANKLPLLLLQGDLATARDLATANPALFVIQYSSSGSPPPVPERVGETLLVTTGDKGRFLVQIEFAGSRLHRYKPVPLSADFRDDPMASRIYLDYLERVREENLLAKVPRQKTASYSGSKVCGNCHGQAVEKWGKSMHAVAFRTLEREGHDADPDCVKCHTVGLDSESGFRSRKATPLFANVGCESCHGPSRDHARQPKKIRLPAVGEASCKPCHTPDNSPRFDYRTYWQKVLHN